jgi:hypothetical protein
VSKFGETLFSGSRFIFWILAPILLIFVLGMASVFLLTDDTFAVTPFSIVLFVTMIVTALLLLLGLYDPVRFHWALRCVTGVVFLAYVSYVVYEFAFTEEPLTLPRDRSEASPINALLGFLIIGLPSLWYTLTGSFTGSGRKDMDPTEEAANDDRYTTN